MKKLCKDRLDHEIDKLRMKGLLEVVILFLVSPEFFWQLHFELSTVARNHQNKTYIDYREFMVVLEKDLKGDLIIPHLDPLKLN